MRVVNNHPGVPIKMWLPYLEDGAEQQAKNLAALPFVFKHVAIMPDSHQGFGMPIGGVLATEGVVIPNAVGVDIGCGMCALKTPISELSKDSIKAIMDKIRETVPVGFKHHETAQQLSYMPKGKIAMHPLLVDSIVNRQFNAAMYQVGTLGGGNHFIELQHGNDDHIWIMVHSGSRNLGKTVAEHYNKIAKDLNVKWKSAVPPSWDLAFLPLDSTEGQKYLAEMEYCVEFAFCNRQLIMKRICEAIDAVTGIRFTDSEMINIAHNYSAMENHFGENVLVHRKGATRARAGEIGIIPGSQGTKSYIVEGKGNSESFHSCSHGAGRKLSRRKATETLDLAEQIALLDAQGIIHGIRTEKDLDEAPGAYKDIDEVMANQADLVDIKVELTPLAVVKG